jgi:solute carrier family 25, member 46
MASRDLFDAQGDFDDEDELDNSERMNLSGRAYNYPDNYNYLYASPRDLTLNLPKTTTNSFKSYQPIYDSPESEEVSLSRYLSESVSLVSLITETLLSHPFIVLRRQCQVHHNSRRYHLVPVTLLPVIVHLHRRQGITTLWKGIGSSLFVRGISLAVEDVSCYRLLTFVAFDVTQSTFRSYQRSRRGQRRSTLERR